MRKCGCSAAANSPNSSPTSNPKPSPTSVLPSIVLSSPPSNPPNNPPNNPAASPKSSPYLVERRIPSFGERARRSVSCSLENPSSSPESSPMNSPKNGPRCSPMSSPPVGPLAIPNNIPNSSPPNSPLSSEGMNFFHDHVSASAGFISLFNPLSWNMNFFHDHVNTSAGFISSILNALSMMNKQSDTLSFGKPIRLELLEREDRLVALMHLPCQPAEPCPSGREWIAPDIPFAADHTLDIIGPDLLL